jgi:hypothetical protein
LNKEDDLYDEEEASRPSSLRAVHKLSMPDAAYDRQLAHDVALANKQTIAELGPLHPGGMPVVPKRKPKRSHSVPLETTEDPVVAQSLKENDTMKLRNVAMASALTVTAASAASSTGVAGSGELDVPENIASFVGDDKALLAYKSVDDGKEGKTVALIVRHPAGPDPRLDMWGGDHIALSCELILLHEEGGNLRETGRSGAAVDCENNHINRRATHLELNEQLELSPATVRFMNDNIRGGSYSYAFAYDNGKWRLSGATTFYKSGYDEVDGVQITKEDITYPKDFGVISMEAFDHEDISDALAKNQSLVP